MKWYSYPVDHSETSRMSSCLDKILELLPLQNHIERQLYTKRVPVVLEGIYAARNEVEAAQPHKTCAHQTIRRLIFLGFTLDVNEVQKLRTHRQTNEIIRIIKRYFHHHRF
jgi:hypothetical protein